MTANLKADRFRQARQEAHAILRDVRGQSGTTYISLTSDRGQMITRICLALCEALDERDKLLKVLNRV